jgi:hypothetical protein
MLNSITQSPVSSGKSTLYSVEFNLNSVKSLLFTLNYQPNSELGERAGQLWIHHHMCPSNF